jgi:alkylhydroperoxidase family enzyme
VRFDSARAAGLAESTVELIEDGYEGRLNEAETAALQLTDALIGAPQPLPEPVQDALRRHYSDAEIVELALGVTLFLGMSKLLITLGLEPETMPTTVLPTPGAPGERRETP